jgi:hypothetical protein
MPAYFLFGQAPNWGFQLPKEAFERVEGRKCRNLESFFNFVDRPPVLNMLLQTDCVLMLGTAAELDEALYNLEGYGWRSIRVNEDDILVINYVRIGDTQGKNTRSLFCLAPMMGWWNMNNPSLCGTQLNVNFVTKTRPDITRERLRRYNEQMIWNRLRYSPNGISTPDLRRTITIPEGEKAQLRLEKSK